MTGSIVRYSSFDMQELDKVDAVVDDLSGTSFMTIDQGENVVRILPGINGAGPFRVTAMHYIDAVPGLDKTVAFACPRHELKEPCPACAEASRLSSSANPLDRERAKKMEASLRVYCHVINRLKPDGGVRVLGFGKSIWDQLKDIRRSPRLGGDFTDPTDRGFDIIIQRDGQGMKTKYRVMPAREACPLANSQTEIDMILSSVGSLDQHVNPVMPDELMGMFQAAQLRAGSSGNDGGQAGSSRGGGTVGAGLMGRGQLQQQSAPQGRQTVQTTGSAVDDAKSFADDDGNFGA